MYTEESKIITFYSYKGGVGRSMALANVAWLLATKYQKRVMVVDWDLEAPGLHRFFNIQEESIKKGLIDLLYDYKEILRQEISSFDEEIVKIDQYLIKLPESITNGGSIFLFPSGKQDQKYATRVNEFDWEDFYINWHGYGFMEYLKEQFKKKADIILIDSRTGVTDTGGICTLQLPDVVTLLFSLNEQNISGIEMIIKSIFRESTKVTSKKERPKLLLVPSRVERYLEQEAKDEWERKAAERLGEYLPVTEEREAVKYLKKKSIPYVGYYSFGEMLAVKKDPDGELADSLNNLTVSVLKASDYWKEEVEMAPRVAPAASASDLEKYKRRNIIMSLIIIVAVIVGGILSYQFLIKKGPEDYATSRIELGNGYLDIAESQENFTDKEVNLEKAIHSFNEALKTINADENPYWYAKARFGLGVAHRVLASIRDNIRENELNLNRSIQLFEEAQEIFAAEGDPLDLGKVKNELGNSYRDLALLLKSDMHLERAIQYYTEALEIFNPQDYPSYHEEVMSNMENIKNMRKAVQGTRPIQRRK